MGLFGYYSAEREEKVIKDIAKFLVDNDFDTVAKLVLESLKPIAGVGGPMLYMMGFPFFMILGEKSMDLGNLIRETPRENIDRVLSKIDELRMAKDKR